MRIILAFMTRMAIIFLSLPKTLMKYLRVLRLTLTPEPLRVERKTLLMVINLLNLPNLVMNLRVTSVFLCAPRARALGICVRARDRFRRARPTPSPSRPSAFRFDRQAYQRPGEMSKWNRKSAFHIYSYSLLSMPSCLTVQRSYFICKIATPEGGREAYRASAPYSPCHLVRIANIFNTKNI